MRRSGTAPFLQTHFLSSSNWHRSMAKPILAGLLSFAGLACDSIVDPSLDPRAVVLDPPAVYQRWWAMTESCSGLRGSYSDVSWYQVPGSDVVAVHGRDAAGYWAPVSNSIVLAGTGVFTGVVVRHEMLHALLRETKGHSREAFLSRCGGVVSCSPECVADAGPPPKPDASVARVPSDALELGTALIPESPTIAVDGGVFTLVVTAKNPNQYPIVVILEPTGFNRTFFYSMIGSDGGLGSYEVALDPAATYFAAGEVKRQYFDFMIGATRGSFTIRPGKYTFYGGFDNRWVTRENVAIGQ